VEAPGRSVVAELCQYTFLLRLLTAIVVVLDGSLPDHLTARTAILVSSLYAVAATWTWRRTLHHVTAHPLFIAVDVAVSLWAVATAPDSVAVFVVALTTALLIGLVHERVPAALLGACLVVGYLGVSVEAGAEVGGLLAHVAALALLVVGGRILVERIGRIAAEATSVTLLLAQAEERSRLAREMHDSVVKTLHGLALSATALAQRPPAGEALRSRLLAVAGAAETGATEARALLADLRIDEPDRPLTVALRDVVHLWAERHSVRTTYDAEGIADLDGSARWELLMCVREALDNVAAHAAATTARVTLRGDTDSVVVVVADDGRGMDASGAQRDAVRRGHYGLRSLAERMERVGGTAEVASAPGAGTRVCLRVPQPRRGGTR
jgi:signal transduction histidine kinase